MAQALSARARGAIALLIVVALWSSTFVATKMLFGQIGPLGIALLRFVIASAILIPLADWRSARPLPWGRFALLGLTGVAIFFVGQNVGLVYTSASAASLIVACVPATIAIAAAIFLKERLNRSRIGGIAASIAGVGVIALTGEADSSAPAPLLGNLLILGGILAWTVYTTLGKDVEHLSFKVTSAASVGFGALFLAPLAGYEFATQGLPALTPVGWIGIVYLGAGASAAAYFLYNYALRQMDASEAAVYLNIIPALGVALAALTLGETIRLSDVVGGVLIIAGVTIASRRAARPAPIATREAVGGPAWTATAIEPETAILVERR